MSSAASRTAAWVIRRRKHTWEAELRDFGELWHVSRRASRSRNVRVIAHYACQLLVKTQRDVKHKSRRRSVLCATETAGLWCCVPVLSCLISPPLPRLRYFHQDLNEPKGEVWKGINPDWHVKWGWIFLLQCPSALSGCVLASSPPPSCAYSGDFQSVVRGPPVVAPSGSQVGAQSRLGKFRLYSNFNYLRCVTWQWCCNHGFHQKFMQNQQYNYCYARVSDEVIWSRAS